MQKIVFNALPVYILVVACFVFLFMLYFFMHILSILELRWQLAEGGVLPELPEGVNFVNTGQANVARISYESNFVLCGKIKDDDKFYGAYNDQAYYDEGSDVEVNICPGIGPIGMPTCDGLYLAARDVTMAT